MPDILMLWAVAVLVIGSAMYWSCPPQPGRRRTDATCISTCTTGRVGSPGAELEVASCSAAAAWRWTIARRLGSST
jgi:hypothetical protein